MQNAVAEGTPFYLVGVYNFIAEAQWFAKHAGHFLFCNLLNILLCYSFVKKCNVRIDFHHKLFLNNILMSMYTRMFVFLSVVIHKTERK